MFKICVIGCGSMSTIGHGPSFQKYKADHPDTCLAGCCDLSEEKAQRYAESFGFDAWYTDYPAMLDAIKPDAVALICPVALTKELSIDIMQRGYNIILEKPPGLNSDQIGQMLAVAKEKGVFVRTSFNRRYTPLIVKLKELLVGKRIFNITYQMYRKTRRDADFATTAIHAIDAVKYIAGIDYSRVDFTYQELPEEGPEERVIESVVIKQALERLTPEERELALLRYVNEVPVKVICELRGCSRFALNRQIKQVLKKLRENLQEKGVGL